MRSRRSERASNMEEARLPDRSPGPRPSSAEQRVDESARVEGHQVVGPLAEADQLDRQAELALDGDDDPALGGAVELGEHHAGDPDRLGELAGLDQRRSARSWRRAPAGTSVTCPGGRSATRRIFFSSSTRLTLVCSRPAVSARTRSLPRAAARWTASKTTALGSPPSAPRTISVPDALGPPRELLAGRGPEGVAGGQQHRAAGRRLLAGELADGRGLADPVHPDEQPDVDTSPSSPSKCELAVRDAVVGARAWPSSSTRSTRKASSSSSPPVISPAATRRRRSSKRSVVVATPTSARSRRLFELVPGRRRRSTAAAAQRRAARRTAPGPCPDADGHRAGRAGASAGASGSAVGSGPPSAGAGGVGRRFDCRRAARGGWVEPGGGASGRPVPGAQHDGARRRRTTTTTARMIQTATMRQRAYRRPEPRPCLRTRPRLPGVARPSGSPPATSRPGAMVTP